MNLNLLENIKKIDSLLYEDEGGGDSGVDGLPSTNTGNLGFDDEGLDLNNTNSGLVPYYGFLQSRYPFASFTFAADKKNGKRKKRRKLAKRR